ncbi:MAG: energy transducer TonB [Candidatus Marinimicrobia bacterium]|nr:energy transducer TonB [Candidatus Neomarinimicrobiota bacterium]MCF7922419.1 energy transducer TonB [Candidatus Neomarinimicrobiota bacterium]
MIKTKLTLTALILLIGTTQLMADPNSNRKCCEPQPMGGIESLEQNTVYPLLDRQEGNEGNVILNFHVDKNGIVSNIRVARSGGTMFDKSAISAVMNTQWSPAMQNGYPVAVNFELPFEYRAK